MLSRPRHAFTLLEVLIALTLLGVGVLGLSAGATLVSRLAGDGSRLTVAATIAAARFERLRAVPCGFATGGSARTRGVDERWSVAPMGAAGGALEVRLAVTYELRAPHRTGHMRTQTFHGAIHCPDA
jgi:prepilin-type N-terminal cleavage/methylation domain-containing protein